MKLQSAFIASLVTSMMLTAAVFSDNPQKIPAFISIGGGTGSGFFLASSNAHYLVTARHVLFAPSQGTNNMVLHAPIAVIKSYSEDSETNLTERILILQLSQLLGQNEIRCPTNHDIALVRFADLTQPGGNVSLPLPGVAAVSGGLTLVPMPQLKRLNAVELGADTFLLGYPASLMARPDSPFSATQPLLRKGIVSGINRIGRKIIIDAAAYQGNSGGPVLQITHPFVNVTDTFIIGIVTEFVPFAEVWENKQFGYANQTISNSGYSVVEPVDFVLDLLWK